MGIFVDNNTGLVSLVQKVNVGVESLVFFMAHDIIRFCCCCWWWWRWWQWWWYDGSDDVDGDCYDGSCDHVVGDDGGNGDLAMIVIIHVMMTTMMIMIMIMKVMIVVKVTIMFWWCTTLWKRTNLVFRWRMCHWHHCAIV